VKRSNRKSTGQIPASSTFCFFPHLALTRFPLPNAKD